MQAATVGVAFGMSSDITAEAADAVIMDASLEKVDELLHIGRRMRSIALMSAVGGMGLSMVGMFAAAFGFLPPIHGAIAQEIIDLAAVDLSQFDQLICLDASFSFFDGSDGRPSHAKLVGNCLLRQSLMFSGFL